MSRPCSASSAFLATLLVAIATVLQADAARSVAKHHSCQHSVVAADLRLAHVAAGNRQAASRHHGHALSGETASVLAQPWRPIKLVFDYTFAEHPSEDVDAAGRARACTSVGQQILIGAPGSTQDCVESQLSNNCLLRCRDVDVMNATVLQMLQLVNNVAKAKFESFLSVQSGDSPVVPVSHDPADAGCDGINVTSRDVINANFVMFVTTRPLHHKGALLAYAMACAADSDSGRPIMGTMNVSPETVMTNADLATVLIHEITHALGFTPGFLKEFRHPQNNSLTYFQFNSTQFPTGPVSGDGIVNSGAGNFAVQYQLLGPGKRLHFVGPNTVAFARHFFACPNITGVEWENGGADPGSTASHWEKRLLFFDYMTATQNQEPGVISGFTLALFNDMGFYRANMSAAETMQWGRGSGCTWADGCGGGAWSSPQYFCTVRRGSSADSACTFDRRSVGSCNLVAYTSALPAPYQYFPSQPTWGGADEFADRCPFVESYANGDCTNPANSDSNGDIYFDFRSGSSRCFQSGAIDQAYVPQSELNGQCFRTVCTGKTTAVVNVSGSFFECVDGRKLGFQYMPRSPGPMFNFAAHPQIAVPFQSSTIVGVFDCGVGIETMCATAEAGATSGTTLRRIDAWPRITSITGAAGASAGAIAVSGDTVTISGKHLARCTSGRIAGAAMTNFAVTPGAMRSLPRPLQPARDTTAPSVSPFVPPGVFPIVRNQLQISSTFGPRFQQSQGRYDFHRGIDYFDDLGTPVTSPSNGTVFQVHWEANGTMPGGGNVVVVEYPLSFLSSELSFHGRNATKVFGYFMHLSHMNFTQPGQAVSAGDVIGLMGDTGTTEFVHLHFEARLEGYCSYEWQVQNNRTPSAGSSCATGFDPMVHPYLFLGGLRGGANSTPTLEEIAPRNGGFACGFRYNATRAHLDLDVIETDFERVVFNTRVGINGTTLASLDDITMMTPELGVFPAEFRSGSSTISYEFHFRRRPTMIRVVNIHGERLTFSVPTAEDDVPIDVITARSPAFSGSTRTGGYAADGTGNVTVDLTCVVPGVCDGGGCVTTTSATHARLVVPPTTTAAPTTASPTPPATTVAPMSSPPPATTTAAATSTATSPSSTTTTGATTQPTSASPAPTTVSTAQTSGVVQTTASTTMTTTTPAPGSTLSPPTIAPTPTPSPRPRNAVRFVLNSTVGVSQFMAALQTVLQVPAGDAVLASNRTLPNGDVEAVVSFSSAAQQSSALTMTENERRTLGVKSAAVADGSSDGSSNGDGMSLPLSNEAFIGIGIGFLVLIAIIFIVVKKRGGDGNDSNANSAGDRRRRALEANLGDSMIPMHQQRQHGNYGGRALQVPSQQQQYAARSHNRYADDIL